MVDNFKHKKSLGQNFLHDQNVLNRIAHSIELTIDDLVIEIGPGQGALSKKIQEQNVQLICYEIDERTKPYLTVLENDKTKIIFKDFLKANVYEDLKDIKYNNLYVIANLPYYITTPIIKKIIDEKLPVNAMVLMVQKEVAERFSAKPGTKDYNSLTIYLNYYFNINKLFNVKNTCFNPVPKVDSAVVKFERNKQKYNIKSEQFFFKLVQDSFTHKRKNLKNNLNQYNLKQIEKVLNKYELSLQSRAEEVPIDVFVDISNSYNN